MVNFTLIGRQEEQRILQKSLDSQEPEMVAVLTMITTFGLNVNAHSLDLIPVQLSLDDLFNG